MVKIVFLPLLLEESGHRVIGSSGEVRRLSALGCRLSAYVLLCNSQDSFLAERRTPIAESLLGFTSPDHPMTRGDRVK